MHIHVRVLEQRQLHSHNTRPPKSSPAAVSLELYARIPKAASALERNRSSSQANAMLVESFLNVKRSLGAEAGRKRFVLCWQAASLSFQDSAGLGNVEGFVRVVQRALTAGHLRAFLGQMTFHLTVLYGWASGFIIFP